MGGQDSVTTTNNNIFLACGQFFSRKLVLKMWNIGQNKEISFRCENVKTKEKSQKSIFSPIRLFLVAF